MAVVVAPGGRYDARASRSVTRVLLNGCCCGGTSIDDASADSGMAVVTRHDMWIFGLRFLTLDYWISTLDRQGAGNGSPKDAAAAAAAPPVVERGA